MSCERDGHRQTSCVFSGGARERPAFELDAFAHRYIFGELIEFLSICGALGFFCGEGLKLTHVRSKLAFDFFDTGCERDERIGQGIFYLVRIG